MIVFKILSSLLLLGHVNGFTSSLSPFASTRNYAQPFPPTIGLSQTADDGGDEQKAVDIVLSEMHESGFPFRIVVIGNGAILETTSILGPKMKASTSPKTGDRLVTLASEDQSFEFHVKVDQVEKVVFAESKRPIEGGEKTLRICRFMNNEGGSICSLILNDSGDEAVKWFDGMKERFA